MILLSLGSNLPSGDGKFSRFENIDSTIKIISSDNYTLIKKSGYYETPSYPDKSNPKFINVVISLKSEDMNISEKDDVKRMMNIIAKIENSYGRKRNKKNEPRSIDVDIIDYKGKVLEFITNMGEKIKIPHERLNLRNFVLFPLKEICPGWIHPSTRKNIDDLIDELSEIDKKSILKVCQT